MKYQLLKFLVTCITDNFRSSNFYSYCMFINFYQSTMTISLILLIFITALLTGTLLKDIP